MTELLKTGEVPEIMLLHYHMTTMAVHNVSALTGPQGRDATQDILMIKAS